MNETSSLHPCDESQLFMIMIIRLLSRMAHEPWEGELGAWDDGDVPPIILGKDPYQRNFDRFSG